jgi:hypothetical protein
VSLVKLVLTLTGEAPESIANPPLETLRRAIPAARGLPLLRAIALGTPGQTILDYLEDMRLGVRVEPCV